jgi:hypothetical protein
MDEILVRYPHSRHQSQFRDLDSATYEFCVLSLLEQQCVSVVGVDTKFLIRRLTKRADHLAFLASTRTAATRANIRILIRRLTKIYLHTKLVNLRVID